MDLWSRGPPHSLGPLGLPNQSSNSPAPCLPLAPYSHKFISVPNMKTLTCSGPISREITNVGYCKIPLERTELFLPPPSTMSVVFSQSLLISDKYRLPIPSGRLSAILSELYFGACQTAGNKTHFITVTCSLSPPLFLHRVHKLLGCAPRVTAFNGAKKEKKVFVLFICLTYDITFSLCY